jgi:hypothetical protein
MSERYSMRRTGQDRPHSRRAGTASRSPFARERTMLRRKTSRNRGLIVWVGGCRRSLSMVFLDLHARQDLTSGSSAICSIERRGAVAPFWLGHSLPFVALPPSAAVHPARACLPTVVTWKNLLQCLSRTNHPHVHHKDKQRSLGRRVRCANNRPTRSHGP